MSVFLIILYGRNLLERIFPQATQNASSKLPYAGILVLQRRMTPSAPRISLASLIVPFHGQIAQSSDNLIVDSPERICSQTSGSTLLSFTVAIRGWTAVMLVCARQ